MTAAPVPYLRTSPLSVGSDDHLSAGGRWDAAPPWSVAVRTTHYDDLHALVTVTGELDAATRAPMWAVLEAHLGAGRRYLRLDPSGVTRVDASALAGLVRTHQDALRNRGTLVITGVRGAVAEMLRSTGLDQRLLISGMRADDDLLRAVDIESVELESVAI